MNVFVAVVPLCAGFVLDLCFGDPRGFPHVIRVAGRLISACERFIRPMFPPTPRGERAAGCVLALAVTALCTLPPLAVLRALYARSVAAGLALESFLCWQLLACRALRDESLPVYAALENGDLLGARRALSMIVGRDTDVLDETGAIKAAVETVAENASDGVVAPLFWMALFGAPGGCFYKSVNTMDSMIGYKNARYRHFGACAARLDDAANFVPARAAGLLMVAAAGLCGYDVKGAWRIFRRDRLKHESPNSAHTEAACAGALGVRLGGPARYEGVLEDKPFLGDPARPVKAEDILRAHRLLYVTSALAFFLAVAVRAGVTLALL